MAAKLVLFAAVKGGSFDYSVLDPKTADEAHRVAQRIRDRNRTAIFDTGRDLKSIKERLGHGHFLAWVEAEFGMSERTAQNYISAFHVLGDKSEIVAGLPATTVYKLASRSTPARLREEIVSRLKAGERMPPDEIARSVAAAKEQERRTREAERKEAAWNKLSEEERAALKRQHGAAAKREAKRQAENEASRRAYEAAEKRRSEAVAEIVSMLRDRMGEDLHRFRHLLGQCYSGDIERALDRVEGWKK